MTFVCLIFQTAEDRWWNQNETSAKFEFSLTEKEKKAHLIHGTLSKSETFEEFIQEEKYQWKQNEPKMKPCPWIAIKYNITTCWWSYYTELRNEKKKE